MAYKTVKERILDCDFEKLLNEFFCYFRDSKEKQPTERNREQLQALINDIKKITPLNKTEVIHAQIWKPYGDEQDDGSRPSINENGFDLRTLDVYINVPESPFPNSFKCCEWEESLGYKVGDDLVMEYGLETIMAAILYEMTWFGATAEEVHNYIAETADALDEVMEGSI